MTQRERLPNRREHVLVNFTSPDGFRYTAGLGYFDDGRLAEIFLNAEKIGTAIETTARDSAVVASLALQHGVPTEAIRRAVTRSVNGSATGPLGTLLDLLASGIEP
jgi:ribonucleoside-diphosphate reductase alpha chain